MSHPCFTSTAHFLERSKHHLLVAAVGLSLAAALSPAVAQTSPTPQAPAANHTRGSHDRGHMSERHVEHLIKAVNGTPEQKAKLTALAQAAQKEMQPLHEQLRSARHNGLALLAAPNVDRAALEKSRSEQSQLMDIISRRKLAHMTEAAEVLTPAQRTILAEKMKSHGAKDQGRRGGREGRDGGHGQRHHGGGWFR